MGYLIVGIMPVDRFLTRVSLREKNSSDLSVSYLLDMKKILVN